MPTRRQSFPANHYFHIYNRGVNRERIFFSGENYSYCLRLMKKNLERYEIAIVAYCLMPNHYHFLLKPLQDNNIDLFMKSLFGSFSEAVNKQQQRTGPLFQGRYRAISVGRDEYLFHVARYIHLNPVMAGLIAAPQDWLYSNYADIIGQRKGVLKDTTLVPEQFPCGPAYQKFVEDYLRDKKSIEELEKYLLE